MCRGRGWRFWGKKTNTNHARTPFWIQCVSTALFAFSHPFSSASLLLLLRWNGLHADLANHEAGRGAPLANHNAGGGVCMEYGCAYSLTEESKDGLVERLWRVRSGEFFCVCDRIAADSKSQRKSHRVSGGVWIVLWGVFSGIWTFQCAFFGKYLDMAARFWSGRETLLLRCC